MPAIIYALFYRLFIRSILPIFLILLGSLYLLRISGHINSQVQYILSMYFLLAVVSALWIREIARLLNPATLPLILVRPLSRKRILTGIIVGNLLVATGSGFLPWALGPWWTGTQQLLLTTSLFGLSIWTGLLYLIFRRESIVAILILPWVIFIGPLLTTLSSLHHSYYQMFTLLLPSPYEVLFISQKSPLRLLSEELFATGWILFVLLFLFLKREELV